MFHGNRLRTLGILALLFIGGGALFAWQFYNSENTVIRNALDVGKDFPIRDSRNEESGLCPWRQPEADLRRFFPEVPATSADWKDATLILTHERALLARLLGREPTAQENAIQIHRLYRRGRLMGIVVTRCIAGESGLIELVMAVEAEETEGIGADPLPPNRKLGQVAQGVTAPRSTSSWSGKSSKIGKVRGARLQRLREPDSSARILQSPQFLGAFRGKTAGSIWILGKDVPDVAADAKPSARAIVEGARAALILLSVGEQQLHRAQ